MKKSIYFALVLFLLFLIYQVICSLIHKEHDITYEIIKNDKPYIIRESFDNKNYFLTISGDSKTYALELNNDFLGQKNILKDFDVKSKGKNSCISLSLVKENFENLILCHNGKTQVAYINFLKLFPLREFKYHNLKSYYRYETSEVKKRRNRAFYYERNLEKNEFIYFYAYKKLDIFNEIRLSENKVSKRDFYENKYIRQIDNFLIIPNYDENSTIIGVIINNIDTGLKAPLHFTNPLSNLSFFNGIVDEKYYLLDVSNKFQYEIDPKKEEIKDISQNGKICKFFNGKEWENKAFQACVNEKSLLNFKPQKPSILGGYDYVEAFDNNNSYIIYDKNNSFYKIYKKDIKRPIYLFNKENITDVSVSNDNIYFKENDTVYRFNEYGIKKILTSSEIKNKPNMFFAYHGK